MHNNILNKKFKYTYAQSYLYIIGLNIAVFLLLNMGQVRIHGLDLRYYISLVPILVNKLGYIWQFVTYMFVHESFTHILFNMYAIVVFGSIIEKSIGTREFLLFYFLTGIISGLISYLVYLLTGFANVAIMGASGAIYGLLFLTAVMFPTSRVLLFFFIPMKMPIAILVFFVIEIYSQLTGSSAGVSHLVHLGGMLFAWFYCLVRFRISPIKVWKATMGRG